MSKVLRLLMHDQVPTVPMQSVRLGGGALGFAFPKNRFILGGHEETQTLEKNQKRKRSHPRLDFRLFHAQAHCSCSFFRVFSSTFPGRSSEL